MTSKNTSGTWNIELATGVIILAVGILVLRRLHVLSRLIDLLLRRTHPVCHASKNQSLPSVQYTWPDGQGNVEKFLFGRQNSVKWEKQYGPVYRIWAGFQSEVVLTDPIDIETVFRDSHNHHKAPANDSGQLMHELLGSCVGLISGHEWKTLRQTTDHTFLRPSAKLHVPLVLTHAKFHLLEWMRQQEREHDSKIVMLHPVEDLKYYPFLVLAEVIYGKLSSDLRQRLLHLVPNRVEVFAQVIQGGVTRFKFSKLLPLDVHRKMKIFKEGWALWNDDAHAKAIECHGPVDDLTTGMRPAILDMYQSIQDGQNTREQIFQTLDEMLFANLDVTAGALSWPLIFLAAHISAQQTVRDELNTIQPNEMESYLFSTDTYLHSVLLETARLRPAAPFSIPQACPTPRIVGGYLIPAGTNFIVDTNALNVRNPVWGPDNTDFRPERWIEDSKRKSKETRYGYWRYGFGPRLCIGRHLADIMLKAMIFEIIVRFDLSLDKDIEWNSDEDSWIHHPAMEIRCAERRP